MKKILSLFSILITITSYSQQEFNLIKSNDLSISIDGSISDKEKANSLIVPIEYEQEPGDNAPSKLKTDVYVTYTDTYIYFGVQAYGNPRMD